MDADTVACMRNVAGTLKALGSGWVHCIRYGCVTLQTLPSTPDTCSQDQQNFKIEGFSEAHRWVLLNPNKQHRIKILGSCLNFELSMQNNTAVIGMWF